MFTGKRFEVFSSLITIRNDKNDWNSFLEPSEIYDKVFRILLMHTKTIHILMHQLYNVKST